MRTVRYYLFVLSVLLYGAGCVSTGKYKAMQQQEQQKDSMYLLTLKVLDSVSGLNVGYVKKIATMQDQMSDLNLQLGVTKESDNQLRKQIQSLSNISAAQAESIKKSMENSGAQDMYLQNLHVALARRDSASLAIMLNLRSALGGFVDQGVSIRAENSVVYVDLADKLLFAGDSGSCTVTEKAKPVLARLAAVLNEQPDLEFTVEGHTDSIAYSNGALLDNWDLSAKRAAAIVRLLQNEYSVAPTRMIAAGRSSYEPVMSNDTPEGQAANRRTRIIILPRMSQLLKVLERGAGSGDSSMDASGS
jgi:chemotaxis protein MotB